MSPLYAEVEGIQKPVSASFLCAVSTSNTFRGSALPNPQETPKKHTVETSDVPVNVAAGQLIRQLREGMGLSQKAFGDNIGMLRASVSNIENGRTLSASAVEKIMNRWPHLEDELKPVLDVLRSPVQDEEENDFDDMIIRRVSNSRPLAGRWFALWEATADDQPVPNIEELEITQLNRGRVQIKNLAPSPDNPKGGYLWIAECRLFDGQHLLGSYVAVDKSIRSKGAMHLVIHSSGRYFAGQWIGCSYDSDYSHGLVVFSREKEELKNRLTRHREQFREYPRDAEVK